MVQGAEGKVQSLNCEEKRRLPARHFVRGAGHVPTHVRLIQRVVIPGLDPGISFRSG